MPRRLEELEEALIAADLGVETAAELVQELARTRFGKEVSEHEVRDALARLDRGDPRAGRPAARARPGATGPQVILVCGVNGTGKTTTIGKLAASSSQGRGERVVLAAGDTFRAAAIEQLADLGRAHRLRGDQPAARAPMPPGSPSTR